MKIEKLGLSINVFDGTELLESLLNELRSEVDYILISYQTKSYCGNKIDKEDLKEIKRLKRIKLVDKIIEFIPDVCLDNRAEETRKRNESIDILIENGCSHVLNIDADEFYNKKDFISAKKYLEDNDIEISYCKYINYYRNFEHILVYQFEAYVPFIISIKYKFKYNHWCVGITDPTRRYEITENKESDLKVVKMLSSDVIMMHHASWIRKDIRKKLENWSAKSYFTQQDIENAVDCYNNFNSNSTRYAKMLFFSKDYELPIEKIDRICNIEIKKAWF
ncbi:MAG: hypothetical protein RSC92_04725 [Clostridia bacterium]